MTDDLQKRIQAALANPQNMGEMAGADSIGTVGNADCGEMLRLWVKSVSYTHLCAREAENF